LSLSEIMLFGGSPFIQDATAEALSSSLGVAAEMRVSYRHRAERVVRRLSDISGVFPVMPESGMFVMADVGGLGLDGEAFATGLLREEGVATMPGSSFGNRATSLIRISLTAPDAVLDEALERIWRYSSRVAMRIEGVPTP